MRSFPWICSLWAFSTLSLIADEPASNPIAYNNDDVYSEDRGYRIEKQDDWDDDDERERADTPYIEKICDFFVTGDFIYWKSRLGGLGFAQTGFNDTLSAGMTPEPNTKRGKLTDVDFDYEPGYKAGGGMNFLHGGWDVTAEYTWLSEQEGKKTVKSHPGPVVASWLYITTGNVGPQSTNSVQSKWHQNFNVVDAEIGKNFTVNRWFSTRLFAGLKFAWIKQKFSVNSFDPGGFKIGTTDFNTYKMEMRQHYTGTGIRFGLDSVWQMSKYLGIYGDLAVDAMWSSFRVYRTDKVPAGSADFVTYAQRNHVKEVVPVVELGIGLTFQAPFCSDMFLFFMRAGWEQQVWFDFNHFNDIFENHAGNLTTQGLTVQIGLGF